LILLLALLAVCAHQPVSQFTFDDLAVRRPRQRVDEDEVAREFVPRQLRCQECREIGIRSEEHALAAGCTLATVLALIDRLNADAGIHGILVQLPLPPALAPAAVIERISPEKDVDGLHPRNLGSLLSGHPRFVPCTPAGIMEMLKTTGLNLRGLEAVVVGRSNIVGKPVALLLLERHATVTICHSRTPDLAAVIRQADVLIAAVGKARLITGEMARPGVAVIDVGINRLPDGKLCGDVDFPSMLGKAGCITPVPGGVGPMTIAMLLENTVRAAELSAAQ